MKAWRVGVLGEPRDVMSLDEVAIPTPGATQVLVRVLAAAANFPDVLICRGEYQMKPDLPFTPGFEVCGEVIAHGAQVEGLAVGDRVIGLCALPAGGYAEYALTDAASTFPAPPALNDAEAAALFIGYQTGWFALHRRAHLQAGETLLVHAAAGGVGSAAVQLGKAAGARVIGVVGNAQKALVARELGADIVIDRSSEDFVDIVKTATNGRGADVIFDPVGGDTYQRSTKCIAFEGRILLIGFAGGQIQSAPLNHALIKNYSIVGLHWGLYLEKDPASIRACHDELTRLTDIGVVRPLVTERLALADVADGLQRLGAGSTAGRLAYVS